MSYTSKDFVGWWKTDQRDPSAEPEDGDVMIDFNKDGTAAYSIYYRDTRDRIDLHYLVEGDELITSQTNYAPLKTKFAFERHGSLLLWFNGIKGRFLRV
jgi:hypothetical protein